MDKIEERTVVCLGVTYTNKSKEIYSALVKIDDESPKYIDGQEILHKLISNSTLTNMECTDGCLRAHINNREQYEVIDIDLMQALKEQLADINLKRISLSFHTVSNKKLDALKILGNTVKQLYNSVYFTLNATNIELYSTKKFLMNPIAESYAGTAGIEIESIDFSNVDFSQCIAMNQFQSLTTLTMKGLDLSSLMSCAGLCQGPKLTTVELKNIKFNKRTSLKGLIRTIPFEMASILIDNITEVNRENKSDMIRCSNINILQILNFKYDNSIICYSSIEKVYIDTFCRHGIVFHSNIDTLSINKYTARSLAEALYATDCAQIYINKLCITDKRPCRELDIREIAKLEYLKISRAEFNDDNGNYLIFYKLMCDMVDISNCHINTNMQINMFTACAINCLQVNSYQYDTIVRMTKADTIKHIEVVDR